MKVYKITKTDTGQSFYAKQIDIDDLFDGSEEDEEYTIKHVEMTEENYEALDEFDGF